MWPAVRYIYACRLILSTRSNFHKQFHERKSKTLTHNKLNKSLSETIAHINDGSNGHHGTAIILQCQITQQSLPNCIVIKNRNTKWQFNTVTIKSTLKAVLFTIKLHLGHGFVYVISVRQRTNNDRQRLP